MLWTDPGHISVGLSGIVLISTQCWKLTVTPQFPTANPGLKKVNALYVFQEYDCVKQFICDVVPNYTCLKYLLKRALEIHALPLLAVSVRSYTSYKNKRKQAVTMMTTFVVIPPFYYPCFSFLATYFFKS